MQHCVQSATIYSDVYRYWHGIEYLLTKHRPGSAAADWLIAAATVSPRSGDLPSSRVLSPAQVQALDAELRAIEPEHLIEHYDAAALDAAGMYV